MTCHLRPFILVSDTFNIFFQRIHWSEMHGTDDFLINDGQQTNVINNVKNTKQKLLQINPAIWFNKWTSISKFVTGFNRGICIPWGWYIFTEICLSSVFTIYSTYLALCIWLILVN